MSIKWRLAGEHLQLRVCLTAEYCNNPALNTKQEENDEPFINAFDVNPAYFGMRKNWRTVLARG